MRAIFLILACSAILSSYALSQELKGAAIVIDVSNTADCISSRNVRLKIGTLLMDNDSIAFLNNAAITLLERDGAIVRYDRPFRLRSRSSQNAIVAKLLQQSLQCDSWLESARKKSRNNFRSGTDGEIVMMYPRNTRLRQSPDRLSWKRSSTTETEFTVSLRCYDNDFSYDETTKASDLSLGSELEITSNRRYYWYARDAQTELSEVPPAVWFYVLGTRELENLNNERATIVSIMNQDTSSTSFQLLYANLLLSYELYGECRTILDEIIRRDPGNTVAYTFYAMIFERIDLMNDSHRLVEYTGKLGQ